MQLPVASKKYLVTGIQPENSALQGVFRTNVGIFELALGNTRLIAISLGNTKLNVDIKLEKLMQCEESTL